MATITVQQAGPSQVTTDASEGENQNDVSADSSTEDASSNETLTQGPAQDQNADDDESKDGIEPGVGVTTGSSGSNGFGADAISNDFSSGQVSQDSKLALRRFDYSTYVYAGSVDTGLLTEQLATGLVRTGRAVLESTIEDAFLSASFWQHMEDAERNYLFDSFETSVASTITAGAIGVTSVVVSFALRAMLIGISITAVNSAQWWVSSFDLSSIIETEDGESIESMVESNV